VDEDEDAAGSDDDDGVAKRGKKQPADDTEWVPKEKLGEWPALHAKLLALKVLRNRCLARAGIEGAMDVAVPVLRLLFTLLNDSGSMTEGAADQCVFFCCREALRVAELTSVGSPKAMARMRLQAAVSLLHLASRSEYAELITQSANFVVLAVTVQVSSGVPIRQ
jgi:sister-chromatid-cohesion protein PDS5